MTRLATLLSAAALGIAALTAQTGVAVPELAEVDREIPALMAAHRVPGGAVAIVKDGRLVFARAYGWADAGPGDAFPPDSLCRIGSISKTVTVVTLLRLVEAGRPQCDDKVYAGILTQLHSS